VRRVLIKGSPPSDWVADAEAVAARLRAAQPHERAKIIDKESGLWRDDRIRNWLLGQFANKCWYTEAKESVSAYHVDHYRPKGRVKDLHGNEAEGYWWLAFEWTNYRIGGQLINVKKLDVFPIIEGNRADPNAAASSLQLEAPLLIDPRKDEARLISYEIDEDACLATPSADSDDIERHRAEATIQILGLNIRDRLNSKRRDFWAKCMLLIADYESAASGPYALRVVLQSLAKEKLRDMVQYEEEFSSVAEACVRKNASPALIASVFEQCHSG
jgi:hypothetical protein